MGPVSRSVFLSQMESTTSEISRDDSVVQGLEYLNLERAVHGALSVDSVTTMLAKRAGLAEDALVVRLEDLPSEAIAIYRKVSDSPQEPTRAADIASAAKSIFEATAAIREARLTGQSNAAVATSTSMVAGATRGHSIGELSTINLAESPSPAGPGARLAETELQGQQQISMVAITKLLETFTATMESRLESLQAQLDSRSHESSKRSRSSGSRGSGSFGSRIKSTTGKHDDSTASSVSDGSGESGGRVEDPDLLAEAIKVKVASLPDKTRLKIASLSTNPSSELKNSVGKFLNQVAAPQPDVKVEDLLSDIEKTASHDLGIKPNAMSLCHPIKSAWIQGLIPDSHKLDKEGSSRQVEPNEAHRLFGMFTGSSGASTKSFVGEIDFLSDPMDDEQAKVDTETMLKDLKCGYFRHRKITTEGDMRVMVFDIPVGVCEFAERVDVGGKRVLEAFKVELKKKSSDKSLPPLARAKFKQYLLELEQDTAHGRDPLGSGPFHPISPELFILLQAKSSCLDASNIVRGIMADLHRVDKADTNWLQRVTGPLRAIRHDEAASTYLSTLMQAKDEYPKNKIPIDMHKALNVAGDSTGNPMLTTTLIAYMVTHQIYYTLAIEYGQEKVRDYISKEMLLLAAKGELEISVLRSAIDQMEREHVGRPDGRNVSASFKRRNRVTGGGGGDAGTVDSGTAGAGAFTTTADDLTNKKKKKKSKKKKKGSSKKASASASSSGDDDVSSSSSGSSNGDGAFFSVPGKQSSKSHTDSGSKSKGSISMSKGSGSKNKESVPKDEAALRAESKRNRYEFYAKSVAKFNDQGRKAMALAKELNQMTRQRYKQDVFKGTVAAGKGGKGDTWSPTLPLQLLRGGYDYLQLDLPSGSKPDGRMVGLLNLVGDVLGVGVNGELSAAGKNFKASVDSKWNLGLAVDKASLL